ncbi:RNase P/RNase MRP complex subunit [Microbotryomycetes sp. JL201]|nr:RNase P/RNase MRP complex subunit [Microbotryomycetes sp. JL201]KAK4049171.1 RNase P/RNase MRP complex subunit [Microbotryomycetes sp. JL201]
MDKVDNRPSAWQGYNPLAQVTRKRLDPDQRMQIGSWKHHFNMDDNDVTERVANKLLQLETPKGKTSDKRKNELQTKATAKEQRKFRYKDTYEAECGLVGRKKRKRGRLQTRLSYPAAESIHSLWLGYMADMLQLPLRVPPLVSLPTQDKEHEPRQPTSRCETLYPAFPSRSTAAAVATLDPAINVNAVHTKLLKAEFVGCKMRVKRAKNPALVNIEGIIVQETQQTFKFAVPKAPVKIIPKLGSVFTFTLPLERALRQVHQQNTSEEISFDIYGDAFAHRTAERVGRKWKAGSTAGGVALV